MTLLQRGSFQLHSGRRSGFKLECNALDAEDWQTAAYLAFLLVGPFGAVEGVPTGGLPFAAALESIATSGPLLIVDDVLTTGGSMEEHRAGRDAKGVVLFARGPCPPWVTPIFTMNPRL